VLHHLLGEAEKSRIVLEEFDYVGMLHVPEDLLTGKFSYCQ